MSYGCERLGGERGWAHGWGVLGAKQPLGSQVLRAPRFEVAEVLGAGGLLGGEDPPPNALHRPHSSASRGPRSRAAAMNCRAEVLEVSVEGRQVEEAMLAVLHTVLLHRSTGKFHYKKEGTYSIGTVGTQDVDCDFIDFAYVRVSSEELDRALRKAVGEFKVGAQGGLGAAARCGAVPALRGLGALPNDSEVGGRVP